MKRDRDEVDWHAVLVALVDRRNAMKADYEQQLQELDQAIAFLEREMKDE